MGFLRSRKPLNIMLVGLHNAGKTTIRNKLRLHFDDKDFNSSKIKEHLKVQKELLANTPIPTIGYNRNLFKILKHEVVLWDFGGQDSLRSNWEKYYPIADGIIYVVDTADHKHIIEAAEHFNSIVNMDTLAKKKFLLIGNKIDLPASLSIDQLNEVFHTSRENICTTTICAVTGQGLFEAIETFIKKL